MMMVETKRGGGYPVIGGGPRPGRSVGVGRQDTVERDRYQGREEEGKQAPLGG